MNRTESEKLILVKREPDGIAYVTINRPKSLNSLTKSMMRDMAQAFKALDRDESVRVIILSGSGRAFCSGVDLTAAEDVFKGDVKDIESDPVAQIERARKPIIGAIGGFAVTAGFEIALACDILVAAKGAKFVDTHARLFIAQAQLFSFSFLNFWLLFIYEFLDSNSYLFCYKTLLYNFNMLNCVTKTKTKKQKKSHSFS